MRSKRRLDSSRAWLRDAWSRFAKRLQHDTDYFASTTWPLLKNQFRRYPGIVSTWVKITSLQLIRFWLRVKRRLHPYAGLISFFGLVVFALTFLVNDLMSVDLREKVSLLRSDEATWILKNSLDRIEVGVDDLLRGGGNRPQARAEPPPATLDEIKAFISRGKKQLFSLKERLEKRAETSDLLFAELPKSVRREFDQWKKDFKSERLHAEGLLRPAVIPPPPKNLEQAQSRLKDVNKAIESYNDLEAEFFDTEDLVLSNFRSEKASSNRHLRTMGYFSFFFLYPASILVGILGQLAGVKSPGGE